MKERGKTRVRALQGLTAWGIVVPHPTPWKQLTPRQRQGMITRGVCQLALLAAALNDLRRRPHGQIRGPKILWAVISCANYLGIGPAVYFVFGRRQAPPPDPAGASPSSSLVRLRPGG